MNDSRACSWEAPQCGRPTPIAYTQDVAYRALRRTSSVKMLYTRGVWLGRVATSTDASRASTMSAWEASSPNCQAVKFGTGPQSTFFRPLSRYLPDPKRLVAPLSRALVTYFRLAHVSASLRTEDLHSVNTSNSTREMVQSFVCQIWRIIFTPHAGASQKEEPHSAINHHSTWQAICRLESML